jgi:hypothetical protein
MDILIGVGGTGAKIVEAVIQLASTGIGPREMQVGFVDQDKSGGNLTHAQMVLNNYINARKSWRDAESTHRVDGDAECPIFATDLKILGDSDGKWVPADKDGSTLSNILGPMNADQYLFDALFGTGEGEEHEEQNMVLDRGYRGRPHVGAAAITARASDGGSFWDTITDTIKGTGEGQHVRILLAGSVFGGTGAAGFPTIARIIRQHLDEANISKNVEIGGALMLPYFGFPDPSDDQNQNVARAHEQLLQARGALRHYQRMLTEQRIFNQLYLVGWDPFFRLDYHQDGGGDQLNPALLPEMLAATAAASFFTKERLPDSDDIQEIQISARKDKPQINWPDIPAIGDGGSRELHGKIAQYLRFAAAFKFWYSNFADEDSRKGVTKQKWYKVQQLDEIDWLKDSPTTALSHLNASLDDFLIWCQAIESYARRDPSFSFNLWNVDALVGPVDFENPNNLPEAEKFLTAQEYKIVFDRIAQKFDQGEKAMPNTANMASNLSDDTLVLEGDHRQMAHMIVALYAYSSVHEISDD